MTWTATAQVQRCFDASPHKETLIVARGAVKTTVTELTGLFLHTQPDDNPVFHVVRSTDSAQIQRADWVQAPTHIYAGSPTALQWYKIEGVQSDGAYILTLDLRKHIRAT